MGGFDYDGDGGFLYGVGFWKGRRDGLVGEKSGFGVVVGCIVYYWLLFSLIFFLFMF